MKFEEPIVRKSDRIRTAKRVEKLGGMKFFKSKLDRLEKGLTAPSNVIRITRQRTLAAKNVQSTSAMYLGIQNWWSLIYRGGNEGKKCHFIPDTKDLPLKTS